MEADPRSGGSRRTHRLIHAFERSIVLALIGVVGLVVLLTTVQVIWILITDVVRHGPNMITERQAFDLLGIVLLVLIGLELLETIKSFLDENTIHVEIVLEVALIAAARKVIVLDLEKYSALDALAIGALIATLAGAFYLERRARARKLPSRRDDDRGER